MISTVYCWLSDCRVDLAMLRILKLMIATTLFALVSAVAPARAGEPENCSFLIVSEQGLRDQIAQLVEQARGTSSQASALIEDLKLAANLLIAKSSVGDPDVLKAFNAIHRLQDAETPN